MGALYFYVATALFTVVIMAITDSQNTKLGRNRRSNRPSFFNSNTNEHEVISSETEDALILIGAAVKQLAAQYLDLLLDSNPSADAFDRMIGTMATNRKAVTENKIAELEPIVSKFGVFKDDFDGGDDSTNAVFATGSYPIIRAMLRGLGPIRNRLNEARFLNKLALFAEKKYAGEATDAVRKEWRSWKRVLLLYP